MCNSCFNFERKVISSDNWLQFQKIVEKNLVLIRKETDEEAAFRCNRCGVYWKIRFDKLNDQSAEISRDHNSGFFPLAITYHYGYRIKMWGGVILVIFIIVIMALIM